MPKDAAKKLAAQGAKMQKDANKEADKNKKRAIAGGQDPKEAEKDAIEAKKNPQGSAKAQQAQAAMKQDADR